MTLAQQLRQEGEQRGQQKGRQEGTLKIAENMLQANMSAEQVASLTGRLYERLPFEQAFLKFRQIG